MLSYFMSFSWLKRQFFATFPVVGPHTHIESDLMLAGKKPLTWVYVARDDEPETIESRGRKRLDEAVTDGRLLAVDVVQRYSDDPENVSVFRHYAQLDQEENLKRVATFNKCAFNQEDCSEAEAALDAGKDFGDYLGYRKRDILFFNYVINSGWLPDRVKMGLIRLNSVCQNHLRDQLLEDAGYDVDEWYKNLPSPNAD